MITLNRCARLAVVAFVAALSTGAASAAQLKVVASFSIIGDMAREVGGDRIDLSTLVGPDGDAHVYEPKPADAAAMAAADVILVNGLAFEGFLPRLIASSGARAVPVEVSNGSDVLPASREPDHRDEAGHRHDEVHDHQHGHDAHAGHDHGTGDPHAWQSVENARLYVANIARAFCAADAAGCETYRANASAYDQKLVALEVEIEATVASIAADRRTIITSHDAFRYFDHAYGITFLAPEGVSTQAEASAADVAALIRQVRADKASAIFVESITDRRLVERIAAETGLTVGGSLYSDALSAADGPASTYLDMMRHNVMTIRAAIVGS